MSSHAKTKADQAATIWAVPSPGDRGCRGQMETRTVPESLCCAPARCRLPHELHGKSKVHGVGCALRLRGNHSRGRVDARDSAQEAPSAAVDSTETPQCLALHSFAGATRRPREVLRAPRRTHLMTRASGSRCEARPANAATAGLLLPPLPPWRAAPSTHPPRARSILQKARVPRSAQAGPVVGCASAAGRQAKGQRGRRSWE